MSYLRFAALQIARRAKVCDSVRVSTDVAQQLIESIAAIDEQVFVIPFAKSAVTSLHTPVGPSYLIIRIWIRN